MNETVTLETERPQQPTTCFACGTENPHGLHVTFAQGAENVALGTFTPTEHHEGWPGIVHGGILATILDEAMAYALYFSDFRAVTVRMETRFRHSIHAHQRVEVEGRVISFRLGIVDARAVITLSDNKVVAEAHGRFKLANVSY